MDQISTRESWSMFPWIELFKCFKGVFNITLPKDSQQSKYTNITDISWQDNENPELLNVQIKGEFKFTHRTNSRGSTNFIILDSQSKMYGGLVATEGRHVKLPCKAEGSPEPDIYWVSPASDLFALGESDSNHIALKGKMDIKSVSLHDNGWWYCVAKSKFYFEYQPIRLTVLPRYISKFKVYFRWTNNQKRRTYMWINIEWDSLWPSFQARNNLTMNWSIRWFHSSKETV